MVKIWQFSLLLTAVVVPLFFGSSNAQSQQEEQEDYFKKWLEADVLTLPPGWGGGSGN